MVCEGCGRPAGGAGYQSLVGEVDGAGYLAGHCCLGDAVAWLLAVAVATGAAAPGQARPVLRLVDPELEASASRHPAGKGRGGSVGGGAA